VTRRGPVTFTVATANPCVSLLQVKGPHQYVRPGRPATGVITLSGPAPRSGTSVALTSETPDLVVPATVTVPNGATTTSFPITAKPQAERTEVRITATADGGGVDGWVGLLPEGNLDGLTADSFLVNDTSAQQRLTLSYAQPTDTVVALSSSDPGLTVPATVTVPARHTSVPFTIAVGTFTQLKVIVVTATLSKERVSAGYLTGPNGPRSLSLGTTDGSGVTAGDELQGLVELYGVATAGAMISLTSDDPHLTVPSTVQIDPGQPSAAFHATTSGTPAADTTVTVIASWNDHSIDRQIVVRPPETP
jgi:hypothetical protein